MRKILFVIILFFIQVNIAKSDCINDFFALNTFNLRNGPYRVLTKISTINSNNNVNTMATIIWNTIPPYAVYSEMNYKGSSSTSKFIVIKDKAWEFKSGSHQWEARPPSFAKDTLTELVRDGFIMETNPTNIKCLGLTEFENKKYHLFSFKSPNNKQIDSTIILFDPATRRPAVSYSGGSIYKQKLEIVSFFEFDSKIKISPPD